MPEYVVKARWPQYWHGDIGTVIRQALQLTLGGATSAIQVHDKGWRTTYDGDTGKGYFLVKNAVDFANESTAKAFPTLAKLYGPPFESVVEVKP